MEWLNFLHTVKENFTSLHKITSDKINGNRILESRKIVIIIWSVNFFHCGIPLTKKKKKKFRDVCHELWGRWKVEYIGY